MSDLIDRQAAIDAVKHAWAKGLEPSQYIEIIPSAEPVRHGKWIWNDKCRRVCSVCENPVAFMLSMDGWHEGKYCPNCGARMDVE